MTPYILLLILFDQLTKYIAGQFFPRGVSYNQGIAFGININQPLNLLSILLILGLVIFTTRKIDNGWILILAGGLSNLLDRFFSQGVIDFISIPLFPWQFNFADVMISMGVLLIIRKYLLAKK